MIALLGCRPWLTISLAACAVTLDHSPAGPTQTAGGIAFTDITKESGITFSHVSSPDKKFILESMSGGVAMFDFDKDGLQDLYFVNAPTVAVSASGPSRARGAVSTTQTALSQHSKRRVC